MQNRRLSPSLLSSTLFVLIACFLAVFTEAANPSPNKKSTKSQFDPSKSIFPEISDYSRFLEEESQQKSELCEQSKHIFLSSYAQYNGFLEQNQTDYFKIVISPRDVKIIVSITNGMDNVNLFTTLDPENRFPTQEASSISTILTQTNNIELQEDDLNLLCERQFASLCYLYISATPAYGESLNYSVLLERSQQGPPRKKPSILLKDSQELHLPVPISGELPEIFYFYAMPYESSFVTLRYPGKKEVRVFANLIDKEMSPKYHTKTLKHGGHDYFWQSEEDSEMGIVQLTISDLQKDDITLVELSVYFEEGEQYEKSSGMYSIRMTAGIMPIIENKQYHETIFSDQYQYYSLDVEYSNNFIIYLEASDIENFTITIATPNQKELPIGPNPLFEVKSQNNTKILEVSTDIIGTWIIGINGPVSNEFTMTVHYTNNDDITTIGNDNDVMVFENGITYSQHLAPAGLLKYLFYVNKLEEFILSINSTGANLKLYLSDSPSDDPTDDLWSLDLVFNLDQQTQILSLPGYEFYNNSQSSEFAIRWNGNENVTLKQKPAYLIIENPTSSDIEFEILLASKERLWKTNTKYSIPVPPQSTLPLILYPNGRIPGLTIEFIVNANEIPQDSILDIKYYFWFEDLRDSQQIFAKQIHHDPGFRIYPVHSLNNTYVVRKDFNFRPDNNRHLVLIRNPLQTPIDNVQAMVSEYEHPNNELSISIRGPTSISHESLFLTPGVWSIWVFSCYKPFYSVEVSNEAQYSLFKSSSSNPELEHFYQIYITESGKYTISGVLPMLNIDVGDDYATRLETAFFPLETKTYKYTLKSQSLKIQADAQNGINKTKTVSVKFEPLKIEDFDDSADSVLYTITVCTVNVTHCSRDGCSFSQSQYGKCRYECFVTQNKTGKLSDKEEIQMSFAMSRSKGYDSSTGTNEYIDRYYYAVFADVMHYDKVVRSVAYQQETIEFEPEGKEMMILIASLSILILIVGFIIYYWRKRTGRKNMRLHEIHPRANDIVRLQAAVDAQDNSEIQD